MTVRTDDTREELALFIRDENHQAKREVPVVGNADYPTKWDVRHQHLNQLITDYFDCE